MASTSTDRRDASAPPRPDGEATVLAAILACQPLQDQGHHLAPRVVGQGNLDLLDVQKIPWPKAAGDGGTYNRTPAFFLSAGVIFK